jgi:hypothetical protein
MIPFEIGASGQTRACNLVGPKSKAQYGNMKFPLNGTLLGQRSKSPEVSVGLLEPKPNPAPNTPKRKIAVVSLDKAEEEGLLSRRGNKKQQATDLRLTETVDENACEVSNLVNIFQGVFAEGKGEGLPGENQKKT